MTDDMAAVRASDELITALSQRREPPDHDVAVDALAALAEYVDAAPRPKISRSPGPAAHRRPRTHRRLGVAIGVALAVSSSGIAAAVTGDPLSPVNFVAKNLYDFAQRHTQSDQQLGGGSVERHVASHPSQSAAHPLERHRDVYVLYPRDDRLVGPRLESLEVLLTASGAADPLSSVSSLPADVLPEDADASEASDGDADEGQTIPGTNDEAEPEPDPVIDPAPGTDDVPPDPCTPPIPDDGTTDDGPTDEPTSCDDPSDPAPETDPETDPEPDPETNPEQEPAPEPDRIPEEEPAPSDDETIPESP